MNEKEWLKEQVGELNIADTVFEDEYGTSYIDTAVPIMQVYDLIDKLGEPGKPTVKKWFDEMLRNERTVIKAEKIDPCIIEHIIIAKESPIFNEEESKYVSENWRELITAVLHGYEVEEE